MCEPGSVATASGYTWNTKPGPENCAINYACKDTTENSPSVATVLMWTPCLCDMKPKYVKITKPEKKLVKQFTAVVIRQSLQKKMFKSSIAIG